MQKFRTVQISFQVHKAIEAERRSFDETEDKIICRILGLASDDSEIDQINDNEDCTEGHSWSDDGVTLPHETKLRMTYNNIAYYGSIVNGSILVGGKIYKSLSGAARAQAVTRKGNKTQIDGWIYWQAKIPGSKQWVACKDMRAEAERQS